MKVLVSVVIALMGLAAYAQEKSRIALDCKAVEIGASEFEEAFSVEEYPEVTIQAIDKSNPMLPAIMEEYTVTIGANSPFRKGQEDVNSVRDQGEGQGHQKYVVEFNSGKSITVEAQHLGEANLTSNDGSLEATLICR